MQFSEIIKELRKAKGITQYELAKSVNLDKTTVGKWEQINAVPSGEILKKLADYFDVTVDYLLGRAEDPKTLSASDDSTTNKIRIIARQMNQLKDDDLNTLGILVEAMSKAADKTKK